MAAVPSPHLVEMQRPRFVVMALGRLLPRDVNPPRTGQSFMARSASISPDGVQEAN